MVQTARLGYIYVHYSISPGDVVRPFPFSCDKLVTYEYKIGLDIYLKFFPEATMEYRRYESSSN